MFICTEPHFHRVRKARSKQKVSHTYRRQSALAKQMGRAVQLDLVKGFTRFKKRVSADAMMEAWKSGKYETVITHIPWENLHDELEQSFKGLRKTYAQSSELSLKALPSPVKKTLRFDFENPRISRWLSKRTGELVVGIRNNTQEIIQSAVQRSFTHAETPRQVADQIKGSIGLDPRREQALRNLTEGLKAKGVSPEKVASETAAYEERLLNSRAMTIARTEVRMANNQGQLAVWNEGQNQGLLPPECKKVWIVDGNPCEICEPMDGIAVGLNDFWTLNTGDSVSIPTESHPNCFCGMELSFGDEGD